MKQLVLLCLSFIISLSSSVYANSSLVQRHDVQQFITKMVNTHHFNRQELTQVINQVVLQDQVVNSMDRPYEKKSWDVYKQLFLTPQRLEEGLTFWKANHEILKKAEQQYGVPANIIVAILGVETLYGKHQGTYRVLDALATLAFNYPKRAPYFTRELEEYLLLCREQHVAPTQYLGSYAGAIGKPQFMPSSYRYYAANFTGNIKKDLMNDDNAVVASVANYFSKHGWKTNQAVAQPVRVNGSQYKHIHTENKTADYSPQQLTAAGIKPYSALPNSQSKVGLIELATQTGQEFWLAYPNFYVITRYNTSPQYAMVVYLLSEQLKTQWTALNKHKNTYA